MKRVETPIPGLCILQPKVYRDSRGFFLESYHQAHFADLGIEDTFVQDNHSCSRKGILRGLHCQLKKPQAKLCRVMEGSALDVAVDIRLGSPTFGKYVSVILSDEQQNEIYIPRGCAHGFVALSDKVHFLYKCTDFYDPADEVGIAWNDPALAIPWGMENPILSEKDQRNRPLAEIPEDRLPRFRCE